MTIGFGQGIAVAPLQLAMGYATLFDGGIYHPPTILKRSAPIIHLPARPPRVQRRHEATGCRSLLRLVVMKGTGRKADAPGYRIGGKTGTAQKLINGHYSQTVNITSFAGVFPMDDPRYVIVVMLDEPKATKETYGFHSRPAGTLRLAWSGVERSAGSRRCSASHPDQEPRTRTWA